MRRIVLLLVVLATAVAVVVAPERSTAPAGVDYLGVSSSSVACPELAISDDSAAVLSGLVAVDRAIGASAQRLPGDQEPSGSAALRRIDGETDLARIPAAGQPVSLLVAKRSAAPILLMADGSWAPTAMAGVATREIDGVGAGAASAGCPVPGPQWWFVGSGSQLGRGAALLVSNPAQEPARFDLTLYAPSGPVETLFLQPDSVRFP